MSRFQMLAGSPLYHGSARTRLIVAKEYARFLAGIGVVMALGKLAGGKEEDDPRSTDFGKIRFGDTRVDLLAGLSQATVLVSRLASGEKESASGKIIPIRGEKVPYGGSNAFDTITSFLRNKLAPAPGVAVDVVTGKDFAGQPVTPGKEAASLLLPMSFGDIYKAMKDQGVPRGAALGLLSIFGAGLQTYEQRTKKKKPSLHDSSR
jgi:hypothetical protein